MNKTPCQAHSWANRTDPAGLILSDETTPPTFVTQSSELSRAQPDDFAVQVSEHVRWGDLDAFGHLNNTVFFQFFESARIAYFERIGFLDYMSQHNVGPILAHTDCWFRRPLTYPCNLIVTARTGKLQTDRFCMEYVIYSNQDVIQLAAYGTGQIVCYDYAKQQKAPLPSSINERIKALDTGVLISN